MIRIVQTKQGGFQVFLNDADVTDVVTFVGVEWDADTQPLVHLVCRSDVALPDNLQAIVTAGREGETATSYLTRVNRGRK